MVEVAGFGGEIIGIYSSLTSALPLPAKIVIELFLLVLLVAIYSVFIWKFYRFVAQKNIIELNLNQYNHTSHPFIAKIFAGFLYFIEYIIVLPFLIFFWFSIFTLFLIFLNESLSVEQIIMVSAVIIAAIRMTSYYSEDLSKDLAKMLPFALLSLSILNPGFFEIERIFMHFGGIISFIDNIIIYLGFIIILEIVLRFFDFILSLFIDDESSSAQIVVR